jgi:pyruvate kinase
MPTKTINTPPTTWNTKIVCTLGPASESEERLEEMIQAGMDVCRLNFSHGEHKSHQGIFDRVRKLSAKYNNSVAILCDVQGPKIRTGIMKEPFTIAYGDTIRVTPQEVIGTPERIQIKYDTLLQDLGPDDIIFINDGIVKLVVLEKDEAAGDLICTCEAPGDINNHKGCNMPSGKLSVNVVTEKDAEDLKFIAQLDPEYVAASFVGTGNDIVRVRRELEKHGNFNIKIVAKVERPVALENIDDIIRESDALMVARGDLGVEIDAWDVPKWQKEIIRRCNKESKPVIVATQMMESMTQNSRPTRAEASDVYNAVLDGADAVMLSGESSVGKHPVKAVAIMDEIVRVAQGQMPKRDPNDFDSTEKRITETMAHAAYTIAEEFKALNVVGKIIVLTRNGHAARLISKYRPALPILAFSENIRTVRELNLVWGVLPHYLPEVAGLDLQEKAARAINVALDCGYLAKETSHVCIMASSGIAHGSGYLTAVYDIASLHESGAVEYNIRGSSCRSVV